MFGMIISLVIAAVLMELGKNTLLGWGLMILATVAFIVLHGKYLTEAKLPVKLLGWLIYTLLLVLCFFVSKPPVRNVPAVSNHNPKTTDIVTVEQGDVQGVLNAEEDVEVYAGIPYAKPPVGELRWKEPQDPDKWEGVLKADHFAPMSMQVTSGPIYNSLYQIIGYHDYKFSLDDNYIPPVSEDSLYLNIWKPAGDVKDLPVLVYVHGGSLQTGQPWYEDYSGEGLAKSGEAIVVNMGYRLGVFGFYANEELAAESPNGTTGNYGLLDQIKALEWVQKNIAAFGGNPDNVTLAGESAGSACVSALSTSPLAKGLFDKVIGESSSVTSVVPPHSFRLLDEAMETGKLLYTQNNVTTLEELRALPAEQIVSSMNDNHHITIDGYVLEKTPYEYYLNGEHNESALLNGYNSEEAVPFNLFTKITADNYEEALKAQFPEAAVSKILELYPASTDQEAKDQYNLLTTAAWFGYSHYCWTRQAKANDIPVYEYFFTKDNRRLGAWHSGEEVYLYHNIPENAFHYTEEDRALSDTFNAYILNFMKTGNPNGDDLPTWDAATGSNPLLLGDTVEMTDETYQHLYDILDEAYGFKTR